MCRHFNIRYKKLRARYNSKIFLANIIPISITVVMLCFVIYNSFSVNPIAYYTYIFTVMTAITGFSFISVLTGSIIESYKLKYHSQYTYADIVGETLIVSVFQQVYIFSEKPIIYKKLYIINLKDIEDIYYSKKNLVVISPTRMFYERADWLTYSVKENNIEFDRWWYNKNGAKLVNGVKIPDMFMNMERIARTISKCSGKAKSHYEERMKFRQKMLTIAETTAFEHKNLLR